MVGSLVFAAAGQRAIMGRVNEHDLYWYMGILFDSSRLVEPSLVLTRGRTPMAC
jgi:hypothetical protein